MKLKNVQITGYRSIKEELLLHVDGRVTVVLGANDHGKSNILSAISHLNEDKRFSDDDINWDLSDQPSELPKLRFQLDLSDDERADFLESWESEYGFLEKKLLNDVETSNPEVETEEPSSDDESDLVDSDNDQEEDTESEIEYDEIRIVPQLRHVPSQITLERSGVDGDLRLILEQKFDDDSLFRGLFGTYVRDRQPRVELIEPVAELNDSVTETEINNDNNEFMQGIFYTAGLNPLLVDGLFEQNDKTTMLLDDSSKKLDEQLRTDRAQGLDGGLHFLLDHKDGRIELLMRDPSVAGRFVRASKRSSGFTHFFFNKYDFECAPKKTTCRQLYLVVR